MVKGSRLIELGSKLIEKFSEQPRFVSQIAHAVIGANTFYGPEGNGSIPLGIASGLAMESMAHSQFGNSLAGAPVVGAGYAGLAIGSTSWNLGRLFDFEMGATAPLWDLFPEGETRTPAGTSRPRTIPPRGPCPPGYYRGGAGGRCIPMRGGRSGTTDSVATSGVIIGSAGMRRKAERYQ